MDILYTEEGLCCRLCGSTSADTISIYNGTETGKELADIINMHLPVTVTIDDTLPLLCCTRCANTITDFHDLVLRCLETDSRLKEMRLKKASHQKDSLDDHTYVEIELTNPPDESGDESLLNEENNLFSSGSTLTILEAHLTNSLPTLMAKETCSNPYDGVLQVKSLQIAEEVEIVLNNTWLKPASYDTIIETKNELMKSENIVEDSTALMQYPCEQCNVMCESQEEYMDHMQETHNFKFEVLQIRPARDKKAKKRRGPKAREQTKQDKAALAAAKIFVNGKVYYQCAECGKNLCSSYTFLWHMRIHTGERPHVCDLCGKQFRVGQGLVRHLRETHQGIKNFPCDICHRMFSSKRNVDEHRNIHTNHRPYICDTCGKRFKQKASLFVHNRSHTDVFPYPCTYCAQTFRTGAALLAHVRRHTGEKPFACDVCGRAFGLNYELKRHRLIHSDEKPFECEQCHLTFRQKRYLRNHRRITHGVTEMVKDDEYGDAD